MGKIIVGTVNSEDFGPAPKKVWECPRCHRVYWEKLEFCRYCARYNSIKVKIPDKPNASA